MAKLADLKALAADLRKRLRQVDQLTGRGGERDRDAARKRQLRNAAKEVQIPACEDAERRTLLESDDTEWLRYYFGTSYDSLATYDIRENIRPYTRNIKYEPGGNGRGIVQSPDGKRLSYLSFTGYPLYSKNVAAWDTSNLEKRLVIYPCKNNGASCFWIAFHPQLMLAAAAIEQGGAICFHRETGEVLPNLVDLKYPPLGEDTTDRVYFSPDGQNLLLECAGDGIRFLRCVALGLTAAEKAKLTKRARLCDVNCRLGSRSPRHTATRRCSCRFPCP